MITNRILAQETITLFTAARKFGNISHGTNNGQTSPAYTFTTDKGGGDTATVKLNGITYDAVLDKNGDPEQITHYSESSNMRITLCFDNTCSHSTNETVRQSLKKLYLSQWQKEHM